MKQVLILTVLIFSHVGFSQSYGSGTYGYYGNYGNSGNYYNSYRSGNGSTVYGYNPSTGSSWSTRYHRDGNASGYDSRGNYWQRSNGTYYNYGTGKYCAGGYCTK